MTRRVALRIALLATLAAGLPVSLGGCCICPTWGKAKAPCSKSGSGAASKAPASAPKRTNAPAVEGAPQAWVAAENVHVTGQPGEDAWAAYSAAGYRTVVNFRPVSEGADREREFVVANGMQYFNIPVEGPNVTWGDAAALAKIVGSRSNDAILLHCSSGNRAAGVWSLYQARYHGLGKDAAIAEGKRVGPMKPATEKRLDEMLSEE